MKTLPPINPTLVRNAYVFCVFFFTGFSASSHAQFSRFAVTNADIEFSTIQASGAASQHSLTVSIRTNGTIFGSGRRYDVASNAVSPSPLGGTNVSVLKNSKLGAPITSATNVYRWTNSVPIYSTNGVFLTNRAVVLTNWWIETTCSGAIFLNDGTKIKGVVSHNQDISQHWDYEKNKLTTNRRSYVGFHAQATYKGGFGDGLSWSNPW